METGTHARNLQQVRTYINKGFQIINVIKIKITRAHLKLFARIENKISEFLYNITILPCRDKITYQTH